MNEMTKHNIEVRKAFTDYVTGKINETEARSLGVEINNGKATIPTTIANEIISYVEQENLLRKYGKVVKVSGNRNYPVLTDETDIKVEVHSEERDPSNSIEINTIGLTAEVLKPVEFDSISIVSRKLLHFSDLSVSDLVVEVMKKKYLQKELDYMFNGTEDKALNSGSLYNKAKVVVPVETEAVRIIKELKNTPSTNVMSKARWVINKAALKYVEDLILPNGEAVLKTSDNTEEGANYLILGYPADVRDEVKGSNNNSSVLYFGDFSSFVIQESVKGLEIETKYEVVGNYQLKNEVAFVLYNLLDGKLIYSDVEPTIYKMEI